MPFMQRITWSGVALHEGVLPGYPASHGCIRMGSEFAVFLWKTTKIGARVIVTHEEPAPTEISNAKLFVPAPSPQLAAPAIAASDGKSTMIAAKSAAHGIDDPDLWVMVNNAPETAAGTPFEKRKFDSYRNGPVSVFVSRKTGKLYVRYDYEPLFETPVKIKNPAVPLGTHVYTAMEATNDSAGMRWNAISILNPETGAPVALKPGKKGERQTAALTETDISLESRAAQSATAALDRIEITCRTRVNPSSNAIHVCATRRTWMPGTQASLRSLRKLACAPGMTVLDLLRTEFIARAGAGVEIA